MISTLIMSKLVSLIEVAWTCLQIPIVQRKIGVKYIDSKPPHLWIKLLSKSRFFGFHPIDIYKCRPSNFENMTFYELNILIHPSLNNMEKDNLSFMIYKNEKLVTLSYFHLVHNNVCFFDNMLLQNIYFHDESHLLSKHNIHRSYVHESMLNLKFPTKSWIFTKLSSPICNTRSIWRWKIYTII